MQKKQGISLIVLVITIIVMIILAASVVITLSNTGIINKANDAVDLTNESAVQDLAALTWTDAYMDNKRGIDLIDEVTNKLSDQGITADKWDISITDTGISVTSKKNVSGTGLGSLITVENYGDKVDYSVTVNGIVYDDWQIYYHNSEYIYLIAENSIGTVSVSNETKVSSLTSEELALYDKFRVGDGPKYTLADTVGEDPSWGSQAVAQLIKYSANFANKTTYGTNVVGAIGGPTIELLAAGWKAKGYTPTLTITTDAYGYCINETNYVSVTSDGLYVSSDNYWLTTPVNSDSLIVVTHNRLIGTYIFGSGAYYGVRPVVCLKSSIPATVGTGDYDFSLTK